MFSSSVAGIHGQLSVSFASSGLNVSIGTKSVDPDQTAPFEAGWSGSPLLVEEASKTFSCADTGRFVRGGQTLISFFFQLIRGGRVQIQL